MNASPDPDRRQGVAAPLLLLVAFLVALLPYLRAGFYTDDAINSTLPGILANANTDVWSFTRTINAGWLAAGRFYPLGLAATYLTWDLAPTLVANRLVQAALVTSNVLAGAWLVRRLTGSGPLAAIFCGLMPALFQIRVPHDPMASFSPLLQLVLLLILGTVLSFQRALAGPGRPWLLLLSLLLYAAALATYEVALTTLPLLALVAAFHHGRRVRAALAALAAPGLLTAGYLAYSVYLKSHSAGPYAGTTMKAGARALTATLMQATGALPLSYLIADPQQYFRDADWGEGEGLFLATLLFATNAAGLAALLARCRPRLSRAALTLLLGLTLFLCPAVLIGLSSRYQEELRWGWAYLPVYAQIFGVGIAVAVILGAVSGLLGRNGARRAQVAFCVLSGMLWGGLAAGSFLVNRQIVEFQNGFWKYPRLLEETAARNGFFDEVPAGSLILRDPATPWESPDFTRQHAGRALKFATFAEFLRPEADTLYARREFPAGVYELRGAAASRPTGGGWLVLARVARLDFCKHGGQAALISRTLANPVCFRQQSTPIPPTPTGLPARALLGVPSLLPAPISLDLAGLPPRRSGPRWTLADLPAGEYQELTVDGARGSGESSAGSQVVFLSSPIARTSGAPAALELGTRPPDAAGMPRLVGVGLGCGRAADAVAFTPADASRVELQVENQPRGFGLAFRVRPEPGQARFATIFSNHGGVRGFTLEQDGSADGSRYNLIVGDGIAWHALGTVVLPPGQWTSVIANFAPGRTELRAINHSGDQVLAADRAPAAAIDATVRLGNWASLDRPFHGQMADITLGPQPFDADQLERLAGAARARSEPPASESSP